MLDNIQGIYAKFFNGFFWVGTSFSFLFFLYLFKVVPFQKGVIFAKGSREDTENTALASISGLDGKLLLRSAVSNLNSSHALAHFASRGMSESLGSFG